MNSRLIALVLVLAGCTGREQAEPESRRDADWVARSAVYQVSVRNFSAQGTLRGVTDGLGYIVASGADVVWLMPIHSIWAGDVRAVDRSLGTEDDLRALVGAIHARGMRIILGVGRPDTTNAQWRRDLPAALRGWLDEFALDGFAVAPGQSEEFWRDSLPALRAAVPRRIMLLVESDDPQWHRAGFDVTAGHDGSRRLAALWDGASAATFIDGEVRDAEALPEGAGGRLRFLTGHDETSTGTPPVVRFRGPAGARAAFVVAALLPGRPVLLNGQEVESPQRLVFREPVPVNWDRPGADVTRSFYRTAMDLARSHRDLFGRQLAPVETSAPQDVIAFRRGRVVVLANARNRAVAVTVRGHSLMDALVLLPTDSRLEGNSVSLPPYGHAVMQLAE